MISHDGQRLSRLNESHDPVEHSSIVGVRHVLACIDEVTEKGDLCLPWDEAKTCVQAIGVGVQVRDE
jgi:hypothetical protein